MSVVYDDVPIKPLFSISVEIDWNSFFLLNIFDVSHGDTELH